MRCRLLLAAALVVFSTDRASAATGFHQLGSVFPAAVQRGTTATVSVRCSSSLEGAYQSFFTPPGIRMTYAETGPVKVAAAGRGRAGTQFKFKVTVPKDQLPGRCEFRLATPVAVSSVSHLLVTDYPVVEEKSGDNGRHEAAQAVPLPAAVCGVCDRAEDVDCYRVRGRAGQQLVCQIFAQRMTEAVHDMVSRGGYHMDPILTLFNSHGQVVAQDDNTYGGDAVVHYRLPAAGEYVLEVRDTRYAGDPRYSYCVEISDQPLIEAVYPLAVQRGTSTQAEVIGWGLDRPQTTTLAAAADEPIGWTRRRIELAEGPSNPVGMLVTDYPQGMLEPRHSTRESALAIELPMGINGRFSEPGAKHWISFQAVKGRWYRFEIEAQRQAMPIDPVVELYDPRGTRLLEIDDSPTSQDPRLVFQAASDGRYCVAIRDLHGRAGPELIYNLRAEETGPDFELQGEYYYAFLASGMRTIWFAKINRVNGFTGPVRLEVRNLPKGVSATPVTIPKGMDHAAIILSASQDAKISASLADVIGHAEVQDPSGKPRAISHRGEVNCELQSQGGGQGRWPIHTQLVGVTRPLDLKSVIAKPENLVLVPGGKAEINVKIERSEGFTDPVGLEAAFTYFTIKWGEQLPPGVTVGKGSTTRLTGKTLEGKIVLEAAAGALPVERLPIAAIASVSISFSINTFYASNPVYLTVPAAPAKK